MNIIFGSGGNDSVALVQFAHENNLTDINVAYSDTGWAADWWPKRIEQFKAFIVAKGGKFHTIKSEGMEALVARKKGWPSNGMAFCSYELKIKPAAAWLEAIDPDKEATCLVGIRREESARRAQWPEWVESSENHGGRSLHSPMVRLLQRDRDELILRAGFDVLPHRSMECFPCVNANKDDLRLLDENRIRHIEIIEERMGYTKNDHLRTMFRPAKHNGAIGIRATVDWASRDKFLPMDDMFCDSGYCGS